MGTTATLHNDGPCRWIRCDVFRSRLRISIRRQGARSGSSLGSALEQNSSGYLARADRPQLTTSVPTAAAPQPE